MFFRFSRKACLCGFGAFFLAKISQNPSKTRPEPFKNRCRKRVDFQHRFFEVLASIWEGLGPPRWSQVGHFGFKTLGTVLKILRCSDFFTLLSQRSFKNSVLEGSKLDFGGPKARFWRVWRRFCETFARFLACCLENVPPVLPPESLQRSPPCWSSRYA